MRNIHKKALIAASAAIASLGALRMSSAVIIEDNESAVVDGWNITVPTGVSLNVTTSDGEIYIEKAANFTVPNQGFQIAFQPVAGETGASLIDISDETVQNNTGQAFSGFDFILLNTGTANATFPSVSNVFAPPTGTGYNYTSVSLNSTGDDLHYAGTQAAGTTSLWGSANPGDNLLIDAPSGAVFSLKELSESSGPTPPSGVPVPAAAWQSLAGLSALALFGVGRRAKKRLA
jgi:hypothetical protein